MALAVSLTGCMVRREVPPEPPPRTHLRLTLTEVRRLAAEALEDAGRPRGDYGDAAIVFSTEGRQRLWKLRFASLDTNRAPDLLVRINDQTRETTVERVPSLP